MRFWCLSSVFSHSGVYTFGVFTTTIFANAGQVVTGNQTPHFLSACRPNYTALGCHSNLQYITERKACTGNPLIVASARKSFPSKDAALSVYSAVYTVVSVMNLELLYYLSDLVTESEITRTDRQTKEFSSCKSLDLYAISQTPGHKSNCWKEQFTVTPLWMSVFFQLIYGS